MERSDLKKIEMGPIGFVSRTSRHENDRDRSLVAKVVLDKALAPALDGIEERIIERDEGGSQDPHC